MGFHSRTASKSTLVRLAPTYSVQTSSSSRNICSAPVTRWTQVHSKSQICHYTLKAKLKIRVLSSFLKLSMSGSAISSTQWDHLWESTLQTMYAAVVVNSQTMMRTKVVYYIRCRCGRLAIIIYWHGIFVNPHLFNGLLWGWNCVPALGLKEV